MHIRLIAFGIESIECGSRRLGWSGPSAWTRPGLGQSWGSGCDGETVAADRCVKCLHHGDGIVVGPSHAEAERVDQVAAHAHAIVASRARDEHECLAGRAFGAEVDVVPTLVASDQKVVAPGLTQQPTSSACWAVAAGVSAAT